MSVSDPGCVHLDQVPRVHATIVFSVIAALVAGCGPEDSDDDGHPPGELEYEDPATQYYRLDRRVDVVSLDPLLSRSGCGFLTDRAYDDLITTIDALDPNVDYGAHPDCPQTAPPAD